MSTEATTYQAEQTGRGQATHFEMLCPICRGALIPLRNSVRCSRCHITLCEGCEGGNAENYCPLSD